MVVVRQTCTVHLIKNMFMLILYCLIITTNFIPESKQAENEIERTFDVEFLRTLNSGIDDVKKWPFQDYPDEIITTSLDEHDILLLSTPIDEIPNNKISKKQLLLENIKKMFESLECFHSLLTYRLFNIVKVSYQGKKRNPQETMKTTLPEFYWYLHRMQAVFSYGNFKVQQWQTDIYSRIKEMEIDNIKSLDDFLADIKLKTEKDSILVHTIMEFANQCQDKHYLPGRGSINEVIKRANLILTYSNWLYCKMNVPCIRTVEGDVTPNFFQLPEEKISGREKYIRECLDFSQLQISSSTEGQTSDPTKSDKSTIDLKKFKLSAEKFGLVCKFKPQYDSPASVLRDVLRAFKENASTRYEELNKRNAITAFENKEKLKVVIPSEEFVDAELKYLVARPDGLVGDKGLVMVKCPYNVQSVPPKDAVGHLQYLVFNENGDIVLKKTTDFYYQVQGLLHIANKDYCYFVVWNPKGLFYEKINRDDNFWENEMIGKIHHFYNNILSPELENPQHVSQYNTNITRD